MCIMLLSGHYMEFSDHYFYMDFLITDLLTTVCLCLQAAPKQRSYSMRQPNSQRHRDRDHGYQPKGSVGVGGGGGGGATGNSHEAEVVVVNGRGNDSSGDSVGSSGHRGRLSPHGLELESKALRLGQAANPNRAEMPGGPSRRPSYDPVSVSCAKLHGHACYMHVADMAAAN